MHISQLIHEHLMFTGSFSGADAVADIANHLAQANVKERHPKSREYKIAMVNQQTYENEYKSDVIDIYTVWREWSNDHTEDPDGEVEIRISKTDGCSWSLLCSYEDINDPALIAAKFMERMFMEAEGRSFSLHKVTIQPAREVPVWSDYVI